MSGQPPSPGLHPCPRVTSSATWTFTPTRSHRLDYVSLCLYKQGAPAYTVTLSIYATDNMHQPVGPALSSTSFLASSLTTASVWREYRFSEGYEVSAGTEYALVISGDGGDSANKVIIRTNVTGGYAGGLSDAMTRDPAAPGEVYTHVKMIAGVLRRRQLDHCFISSALKPRVRSVHAANGEVASDHHPLWIDIDLESAA